MKDTLLPVRSRSTGRWGYFSTARRALAIPAEFSRVSFKRGSVGMARKGGDNNSATSQFFICLEPRPMWDGQYTVVGEVVQGLNNVQIISNVPTEPGGEKVRDKVVMKKVYLEKRAAE